MLTENTTFESGKQPLHQQKSKIKMQSVHSNSVQAVHPKTTNIYDI